jgi:hypothetical protein
MSTCDLSPVEFEVMDATADDVENLEQIYKSCQLGPSRVLLTEVAKAVLGLVGRGLLDPVMDEEGEAIENPSDPGLVWKAWFRMTPEGRKCWEAYTHAEPLAATRASRFGAWKDIAPDVPLDEFIQTRQGMWGGGDEGPGA